MFKPNPTVSFIRATNTPQDQVSQHRSFEKNKQNEANRKRQKEESDGQKEIMETIPSMRGVSEAVAQMLRR